MTLCVSEHHFNINERRPRVKLQNGTEVPWTYQSPLQSDITTLLSFMLAGLRLVAACWIGPLYWRCAFILMREYGLKHQHLQSLVSYGIMLPSIETASRSSNRSNFILIWIILALALPAQFVAPILTGSITWEHSGHPHQHLSNDTILIPEATYDIWNDRMSSGPNVGNTLIDSIVEHAALRTVLTWGRDANNSAIRRFIPELGELGVGSKIDSVVLPYFSVDSIEWLGEYSEEYSDLQYNINRTICPKLNITGSSTCPISQQTTGSIVLNPTSYWTDRRGQASDVVAERRLLIVTGSDWIWGSDKSHVTCVICRVDRYHEKTDHEMIGHEMMGHYQDGLCVKYAWVSYTAGVVNCYNCSVSSDRIVQLKINDAPSPSPGPMIEEALRIMPLATVPMVLGDGSADIYPLWHTLEDMVIGILSRSYAASWMALNDRSNHSRPTGYWVSPAASLAVVNMLRLYLWAGFQLLVTLSGVLFIYVQVNSSDSILGNTALFAFYTNTSAVTSDPEWAENTGGMAHRIETEGEYLRLKVN
ncbi:hypothetical protein RHS04_05195 [Rhizoctonia solani]|uniref:Uncharacterized protein n=1 Tax=Rhizoctonia solani TaxID=456999 RepID=A0A8H7H895_9AGAM|nr:hypothetical protein RHS04_05195 [Rhizoctonia solani]